MYAAKVEIPGRNHCVTKWQKILMRLLNATGVSVMPFNLFEVMVTGRRTFGPSMLVMFVHSVKAILFTSLVQKHLGKGIRQCRGFGGHC